MQNNQFEIRKNGVVNRLTNNLKVAAGYMLKLFFTVQPIIDISKMVNERELYNADGSEHVDVTANGWYPILTADAGERIKIKFGLLIRTTGSYNLTWIGVRKVAGEEVTIYYGSAAAEIDEFKDWKDIELETGWSLCVYVSGYSSGGYCTFKAVTEIENV